MIMEKLDLTTKIALIKCYYECGKSPIKCLRQYGREMQLHHHVCDESTIRRLVQRFEATGSVADLDRSGRPQIQEAIVDNVKQTILTLQSNNPLGISSTSQIAQAVNMPRSTVHKVIRTLLNWHPYRLRFLQELKDVDFEQRRQFAHWFRQKSSSDRHFLSNIV